MPTTRFAFALVSVASLSACAGSSPTASASASAASSDEPSGDVASATSTAATSTPASADGWTTFEYGPGVHAEMPGTPTDTGVSGVFALKRGQGSGMSIQCTDGGASKKERSDTLTGMKRGIVGERKLVSEKKVQRGDAEGVRLEVETQTTAGVTRLHVLLLAGSQQICSFTSITDASAPMTDTDRFLDSAAVR